MKLIWIIISIWIPASSAFANCYEPEIWPKLTEWMCATKAAMNSKDQGKNYHRSIHLITDHDDIQDMRRQMNENDLQVCRLYPKEKVSDALERITRHQGFSPEFIYIEREAAAKELVTIAARDRVTVCEGEVLTDNGIGNQNFYEQFYFIKLGPAREYKNLMLRVTTRWPL